MEEVILVDDQNNVIGTAPKHTVHTHDTPLHRAFSCFIFNSKKQVLVTKRSSAKKTFPGVWTNTVCGHPGKGESIIDAAKRRLMHELGLLVDQIKEAAPYQYRCSDKNGIVENEICPILTGFADANPHPHDREVDEWKWMNWYDFLLDLKKNPHLYSPWAQEEAVILQQTDPALQ
jgi:isopentenyl-diphosphate delta-isomerase type 1